MFAKALAAQDGSVVVVRRTTNADAAADDRNTAWWSTSRRLVVVVLGANPNAGLKPTTNGRQSSISFATMDMLLLLM